MFEGHINRASFGESRESEVLRRFRWTDLVARLAATRDLREELGRDEPVRHGEGDFLAFGAVRRECEEGESRLNHDVSGNLKGDGVSVDEIENIAMHGDRGKE